MTPTRAVNKHREPFDVYIGRGSDWGNPFVIGRDGDRAEVIRKYEEHLAGRPDLIARLGELRGKRLGCSCAPAACHGDVLARWADDGPAVGGEPIRVLITGSREFRERTTIATALTAVARERPGCELIVVHGDARGADRLAGAIARKYPGRLREEKHVVTDWRRPDGTIDKQAGHRRNQRMVDAGAAVCLAFLSHRSENRGTRGAIAAARRAGIEVREHWDAE